MAWFVWVLRLALTISLWHLNGSLEHLRTAGWSWIGWGRDIPSRPPPCALQQSRTQGGGFAVAHPAVPPFCVGQGWPVTSPGPGSKLASPAKW